MFNVGGGEMLAIFLLALIVLGPERLPKAMGQVGRAVAQMRKLSSGFQDEIRRAMDPMNAPFRPGEETLPGPVPSVTDEVRVVNAGDPADAELLPGPAGSSDEGPSSGPVGLEKPVAPAPVVLDKPARAVTPLRPVAAADDDARR